MALDLPRLRDAVTPIEPALGLEFLGGGAPEHLRAVHVPDGGRDDRAFADDEAAGLCAGRCGYGGGEGDDVVFCSLRMDCSQWDLGGWSLI